MKFLTPEAFVSSPALANFPNSKVWQEGVNGSFQMRDSISQRDSETSVQGEKLEIPPELCEVGTDGQPDPLATLTWEMGRFLLRH